VTDLDHFFKERVSKFTKSQFTSNLITTLKKFVNDPKNKETLVNACEVLNIEKTKIMSLQNNNMT